MDIIPGQGLMGVGPHFHHFLACLLQKTMVLGGGPSEEERDGNTGFFTHRMDVSPIHTYAGSVKTVVIDTIFKGRMAVNVFCLNLLAFQRALRKNVLQRPSFLAHFPFKIGQ